MGKGSKKPGRVPSYQISSQINAEAKKASIDFTSLNAHFSVDNVSISLRYYKKSCECFSDWTKQELKKFSLTVEKLNKYNVHQLINHKPLCDVHKGQPKEKRFSFPEQISPDQRFYEIKVDPSNKIRIHGFFSESIFFLVWLDREHACFPE